MASQPDLITGLDIGSSSIRLTVAQRVHDGQLQVLAAVTVPTEGVNRGIITSIDDATSALSAAKEKAERISGYSLDSVWVGISGPHILTSVSRGVVAVGKASGEIEDNDINRALEAARAVASPPNYEILHAIPRSFTVDGQAGLKDPVGMTGIRLEVETTIIQGLTTQLKNITRVVQRAGFRISGIVLSVLAAAESHVTERQRELGVVVVNIGGTTTSVAVFEEGDLLTAQVLPIGSEHVTADIAIGLRTSLDIAEEVKLHYGTASVKDVAKKEDIDLSEFGANDSETVSRKYVAEIIEARTEEILDKIDAILKKVDRSGMLPAGIVFVGGGAKLPGLIDIAKKRLRLPVSLGHPKADFMSAVDTVNDLSFASSIGLVLWGDAATKDRERGFGSLFGGTSFRGVGQTIRSWFASLLP